MMLSSKIVRILSCWASHGKEMLSFEELCVHKLTKDLCRMSYNIFVKILEKRHWLLFRFEILISDFNESYMPLSAAWIAPTEWKLIHYQLCLERNEILKTNVQENHCNKNTTWPNKVSNTRHFASHCIVSSSPSNFSAKAITTLQNTATEWEGLKNSHWTRWNQWKNTFLPMYCVVYWPCCEILLKWYIEFFQHWIHGLCRWLLFCYRSFHKLLTQKRHTCKYNWQWTGFHSIVLFYAVLCVIQISSKSCIQKIFQNSF